MPNKVKEPYLMESGRGEQNYTICVNMRYSENLIAMVDDGLIVLLYFEPEHFLKQEIKWHLQ